MKKCGYEMNVEFVAQQTNARRDERSAVGWSFNTDALAAFYERIGLEVTRRPSGSVAAGKCKICGEWSVKNAPTGTRAVHCDPEAHAAYYDALEAQGRN